MLSRFASQGAYHRNAIISSVTLLCRQPIATLMTVAVIAIALALPTLLWVFTDNVTQLTKQWQSHGHLSLYLKPGLSLSEQQHTTQAVQAIDGVSRVSLISAEEGLTALRAQEGMQDILHSLTENPLPAVIIVVPKEDFSDKASLMHLSQKLRVLPQADDIKMDVEWIERLHAVLGFVTQITYCSLILLAVAVMLIIANTLRLTIQNQREAIEILKLVGATNSFIMRPFLYSGIEYGLASAMMTLLLVNICMFFIESAMNRVILVYHMHLPLTGLSLRQTLLLFLFAIILGWLGAFISVKRQLAVIEP